MGKLTITVLNCRNLPRKDFISNSCDPYVKLNVDNDRYTFKTSHIKADRNPQFNTKFECASVPRTATIAVTVMDHDAGTTDDKVGTCFVSLEHLQRNVTKTAWFDLLDEDPSVGLAGSIQLSLHSQDLGNDDPIDEEMETQYKARLRRFFMRYDKRAISMIDVYLARHQPPNWEGLMQSLVAKHGAEPGTARLSLRVIKCTNLPKMDRFGKVDPYVSIIIDGEEFSTKVIKKDMNPVFNAQWQIDVANPSSAIINVACWDVDVGTGDELVGTTSLKLTNLSKNTRTPYILPLVHNPGHTSAKWRGDVHLELYSADFGNEQARDISQHTADLAALYKRYCTSALHMVALQLADNYLHEEKLIQKQVDALGSIPGTARLKVTVKEVKGLMRQGKFVKKPDPYVVLSCPLNHARLSTKKNTKAATWENEAQTFDIQRPASDVLKLTVFDDDVGADYEYGIVNLSLQSLQRGVRKERTFPIIHAPGSKNRPVGFITVVLESPDLGHAHPVDEEMETHYRGRLTRYYGRLLQDRLVHVDVDLQTKGDMEQYITQTLVPQHGPEPGTYKLKLTVVGAKELPKVETFGGADPYVTMEMGLDNFQTKTIKRTLNPTWNESFTFDIGYPDKDELTLTVWDEDLDADDVMCRVVIPVRHLARGVETESWYPLIYQFDGVNPLVRGQICLKTFTSDFGVGHPLPNDKTEAFRSNIVRQLERYDRRRLLQYEQILASGVGNEDRMLEGLVRQYGCLPGTARLKVTVKEVKGLMRQGKFVKKPDPYVVLSCPLNHARLSTKKNTKAATWENEAQTFDIQRPASDVLKLTVFDDDVGADYEYGIVNLSLQSLQRGVRKERTFPIIHAPGSKNRPVGFITVVLESPDLGHAHPVDEEMETHYRGRLTRYYGRLLQDRLVHVDVDLQTKGDMEQYITQTLVPQHGPEPGTYKLKLTVVGAKELPTVETFGGADPYVTMEMGLDNFQTKTIKRTLNPTWNESFTFDIGNPDKDELTLTVWDEDLDADDVMCRVVIPMCTLVHEVEVTRTYPLIFNFGTDSASKAGSIELKLFASGFGCVAPMAESVYSDYRCRILKMLELFGSKKTLHMYEQEFVGFIGGREEMIMKSLESRFGVREPGSLKVIAKIVQLVNIQGTNIDGAPFYVKMYVRDRESVGKTAAVRRDASSNVVQFAEASSVFTAVLHEEDDVVSFKLANNAKAFTSEIGRVNMTLAHLVPDVPRLQRLYFWNEKSGEVATLVVEVTVVGCDQPLRLPEDVEAQLIRDGRATALQYAPSRLPDLYLLLNRERDALFSGMIRKSRLQKRYGVCVHVDRCTNLPKMDTFGTCDGFVAVSTSDGVICKTPHVPNTYNPIFTTQNLFRVDTDETTIYFKVYDKDKLSNDEFIGIASISLLPFTNGLAASPSELTLDIIGKEDEKDPPGSEKIRGTLTVKVWQPRDKFQVPLHMPVSTHIPPHPNRAYFANMYERTVGLLRHYNIKGLASVHSSFYGPQGAGAGRSESTRSAVEEQLAQLVRNWGKEPAIPDVQPPFTPQPPEATRHVDAAMLHDDDLRPVDSLLEELQNPRRTPPTIDDFDL